MSRYVIRPTGGDIEALVFDSETSTLEVYDEVPSDLSLEKEEGDPLIRGCFSGSDATELVRIGSALLKAWEG